MSKPRKPWPTLEPGSVVPEHSYDYPKRDTKSVQPVPPVNDLRPHVIYKALLMALNQGMDGRVQCPPPNESPRSCGNGLTPRAVCLTCMARWFITLARAEKSHRSRRPA